jgi:glycosyltransferase involved in cell wall biosynthesis
VVKPNFVAGDFKPKTASGEYALFVGRLSEEKGPQFLVSAWRMMQARVPLRVVGNGPLLEKLARGVRDNSLAQIELTGRRTPEEVRLVMHGARFLVFPSIWYEGFPITIAEAFASGLPVIASRLGSMPEIVRDGSTGLLFKTGDADDLAAKAQWAWTHPAEMESMGRTARHEFETKYSASVALQNLEKAYELALKRHAESGRSRQPLTENKSLPPPNRMHEAD